WPMARRRRQRGGDNMATNILTRIRSALTGAKSQLDDIRERIASTKAERHTIASAPPDRSAALKWLDVQIAAEAARFETSEAGFTYLLSSNFRLRDIFDTADPAAMLCWFDGDRMREKLIA